MSSAPGEIDDGDYATLRGPTGDLLHFTGIGLHCDTADDTSEEGKLLESVRDDSVTYASTRDLEPPMPSQNDINMDTSELMLSPLAPVMVTVHTNEIHVSALNQNKITNSCRVFSIEMLISKFICPATINHDTTLFTSCRFRCTT